MNKIMLIVCALFLNLAFGHGVSWKPMSDTSQAQAILFTYDDGSLMSFAEVKIHGPDGKTFQNGRTDKNGVFTFMPSTTGEWKLSANDGMGHLAQASMNIDLATGESAVAKESAPEPAQGLGKLIKIVLVASLLINFSLIFKFYRDRKCVAPVAAESIA